MLLITLILFLISCLVLVISGGYLVKLIVKIASYLKLSEFVVAFIIMAFSTSVPELFVGINSAISGNPALSLGNVIGSNIADLTLVIGVAALLGRGIKLKNPRIKKDSLFMFLIALVPIALMIFDTTLSRIDGVILTSIFIIYMWHLIKERKELNEQFVESNRKGIALNILFFILCLGALFLSAHFVVKYAVQLAVELLLPAILIGLFFVAIGTSLPELVFETRAVLARKGDLAVGDAMGSVVCNSTLVLGITAMISPITNSFLIFLTSAIFMVAVTFLFMMFVRSKKGLSVTESAILIMLYITFILFEFYFKR
ncbi:calcium/sodium antiporter [Candidatus Woesearchaeota archaeon]|nr:calcium/sodium antiporter [Candidatus Woesearchaeota archaeon]